MSRLGRPRKMSLITTFIVSMLAIWIVSPDMRLIVMAVNEYIRGEHSIEPKNYTVFWENNYTIVEFRVKYGDFAFDEVTGKFACGENPDIMAFRTLFPRIAERIANETGLVAHGTRFENGTLAPYNFHWGVMGHPIHGRKKGVLREWLCLQVYAKEFESLNEPPEAGVEITDELIDTILRIMLEEVEEIHEQYKVTEEIMQEILMEVDTDGDGLSDWIEINLGTDPFELGY